MTNSEIPPLVDMAQLRSTIEYYARRNKTFQAKADAERVQLRDCVVRAVQLGMSELEASKVAGIHRNTVRDWLGK